MSKPFNSKYASEPSEWSAIFGDGSGSGFEETFDPDDPVIKQYLRRNIPDNISYEQQQQLEEEEGAGRTPKFRSPKVFQAPNPSDLARKDNEIVQKLNTVKAAYTLIDRAARKTHPCPTCRGALAGGNVTQKSGNEKSQQWCRTCQNTGHTLGLTHNGVFNMLKSIRAHNKAVDFHDNVCLPAACHSQCQFKNVIDRDIRGAIDPVTGEKREPWQLKMNDTHIRPGHTKTLTGKRISEILRPQVMVDHYKPIADAFKLLGGHEDEPLKKFDFVKFTNHDIINPDSTLNDGEDQRLSLDERDYNPQRALKDESRFNATGGGRDKQMHGVIHSISADGKTANVIVHYRPLDKIRAERTERIKGRPDRGMKYTDGINATDTTWDRNPATRAFKDFVGSVLNKISPLIGERSPVARGTYKLVKDVPVERLGRLSEVTAPLDATSGSVTQTVPRKELKGWYEGKRRRPLTQKSLDKKVKADVFYRLGHGFSNEEFKEGIKNTSDAETRSAMESLATDADNIFNITAEHPLSLKPRSRGRIHEPLQQGENPLYQPHQTRTFNSVQSPDTLVGTGAKLPTAPVPHAVDLTSSSTGRNEILDMLEKQTGRKIDQAEGEQAIKAMNETNSIHGALSSLGASVDSDKFEEDDDDDYGFSDYEF